MNGLDFWRPGIDLVFKGREEDCMEWFRMCHQGDVSLFQIRHQVEHRYEFSIAWREWRDMRKEWIAFRRAFRKNSDRVQPKPKLFMQARHGWLFRIHQVIKSPVGWITSGVFLIVLMICSNLVWHIQIAGATLERRYEVQTVLDDIGLKKWEWISPFQDVDSIARQIQQRIPTLAWVSVQRSGTRYHVQMEEMRTDEIVSQRKNAVIPMDLVATKDAVISHMSVEQGQPRVLRNTSVRKGEVLVSGWIGTAEKGRAVEAKGKVFGNVWKRVQVEFPLVSKQWVYTGKFRSEQFLQIGPWYWDWNGEDPDSFSSEVKKAHFVPFQIGPFQTGIGIREETTWETRLAVSTFPMNVAEKKALQLARQTIRNQSGSEAKVRIEKVLQVQNVRDKVKLLILYETDEPISTSKPMPSPTATIQPTKRPVH